jgi:hypothetical protein
MFIVMSQSSPDGLSRTTSEASMDGCAASGNGHCRGERRLFLHGPVPG